MRALVTGATGFVGGHLVSRLAQQGDEVRALARKGGQVDHLLQQDVQVVFGDLKDRQSLRRAVAGVDAVYHAAAATRGTWQEYEESTVKGTQHLLEASLEAGVRRFIHVSSIAVYRVYDLAANTLVDETYPLEDAAERVGPYTWSKLEAEKLALRFSERGLPIVIFRPGIIYGPRGRVLFPHLGYFVSKKLFILIGRGTNLLPFTFIDNTIDAFLLAVSNNGCCGQAYNIVDDGEITQRKYLMNYEVATQSKFLTIPLPFSFLLLFTTILEQLRTAGILKKAPSPSKYGLVSKYKSLRFDTSKAKKQLNWQPKVSLDNGLRTTLEWYNKSALQINLTHQIKAR